MKKISMVGNTHFDPVWLWSWDEAMSSITATFRSALERMEEYPEFHYSFSAPAVFEWIKHTDSELFERIKKRIEEGRWELCEGWWLQADCNSALGESYLRQGLYAQKYFEKNFHKRSDTVFNIDSFGHPATLPKLLAGCGIKNYVFWRYNEDELSPDTFLFHWKGDDGTVVKAYRTGGKGGEIYKSDLVGDVLDPLMKQSDKNSSDIMVVFGVTDHGGAPTKKMIEDIIKKREELKDLCKIDFSRVDEFFEQADMSTSPEVAGEIQVKFPGPYSNFTEIKKNNRKCEYKIMNAEKVSVIAEKLMKQEYPKEAIDRCWQDLMFNQFHDILGGCCIKDAYFDARNLHGRAMQTADEIIHFGLLKITNQIKMPGKNPDNAWNLTVWNLNGEKSTQPLEAEVQWAWEFDWYSGGIVLVDEKGEEYPTQIITERCVMPGFRSRFVFRAEIPPLGYKSFIVKQTGKKVPAPKKAAETERYLIEYDETGIKALKDKKANKVLLTELFRPYAVADECDTWGFNQDFYDDKKQFMKLKNVRITEAGEIRTSIKLDWEYHQSTLSQTLIVYDDAIDCRYQVFWNEEKLALKLYIAGNHDMNCEASAPYGSVVRQPSKYEKPMGEWITLYNAEETISVIADSAFAYHFDGRGIGITLLRNCLYGDLRTEPLDPQREYEYMGKGITEGAMRILFKKDVYSQAIAFQNPPIILYQANHDGTLDPSASFYEGGPSSILTTLKKAEEGEGYILRLHNPKKEKCEDRIKLFDVEGDITFAPLEIKSLAAENNEWIQVNMLEDK